MPFLPAEEIPGAVREAIQQCLPATKRKLKSFFKYYNRQWMKIVKPEGFSIYGLEHRTTNMIESLNATLKRIIKAKPSAYTFVGKCLDFIT